MKPTQVVNVTELSSDTLNPFPSVHSCNVIRGLHGAPFREQLSSSSSENALEFFRVHQQVRKGLFGKLKLIKSPTGWTLAPELFIHSLRHNHPPFHPPHPPRQVSLHPFNFCLSFLPPVPLDDHKQWSNLIR